MKESSSTRNQSTIGSETTVLLPRKKQKRYLYRWMKNKTKKLSFDESMYSDIGSTSSQGAGQVVSTTRTAFDNFIRMHIQGIKCIKKEIKFDSPLMLLKSTCPC